MVRLALYYRPGHSRRHWPGWLGYPGIEGGASRHRSRRFPLPHLCHRHHINDGDWSCALWQHGALAPAHAGSAGLHRHACRHYQSSAWPGIVCRYAAGGLFNRKNRRSQTAGGGFSGWRVCHVQPFLAEFVDGILAFLAAASGAGILPGIHLCAADHRDQRSHTSRSHGQRHQHF